MIQPQNGQPGVIGQQHGLARLTTTLEALEKGQRTQQQRDEQLQAQLTDQATRLAHLGHRMQGQLYALTGLSALVLLLGGLVGWQVIHPPEQAYARALGSIDGTLVQQWPTLPKGAQEALADTYRRQGLLAPGQRK